jgi:hypothetical protein
MIPRAIIPKKENTIVGYKIFRVVLRSTRNRVLTSTVSTDFNLTLVQVAIIFAHNSKMMFKTICTLVYFIITTLTTWFDVVHAQNATKHKKKCQTDPLGNKYGRYGGTFKGWINWVNYTSQGITSDYWPKSYDAFYCGMRTPKMPHTIKKGLLKWIDEKDYGADNCASHDVQLTFKKTKKQWIYNHSCCGEDFRGPMLFQCFESN